MGIGMEKVVESFCSCCEMVGGKDILVGGVGCVEVVREMEDER